MPKRYTSRRRKRVFRRRKGAKRSSKFARKQQRSAMTYVKKKYTKTFVLTAAETTDQAGYTISLIGGKNAQNPSFTISLFDAN